jgi:hypothetical protein
MAAIERAYHRALTQLHLEQTARRKREAEAPPGSEPPAPRLQIVPRAIPTPTERPPQAPWEPWEPQSTQPLPDETPPPS